MIGVGFDGQMYIITVTCDMYYFIQRKYEWTCKNKNDIKKFKWIFDKIMGDEGYQSNLEVEIVYNMSVEECIKHNNNVQMLLTDLKIM